MQPRHPKVPFLLLMLILSTVPGCSKRPADELVTSRAGIEVYQVYELYREHIHDKKRPPTKLADLELFEAGYPIGYQALRNGQCVAFWGVSLAKPDEKSDIILAYEKDTPTQGGLVVMKDGTVKKLTAEEFKAAPKS